MGSYPSVKLNTAPPGAGAAGGAGGAGRSIRLITLIALRDLPTFEKPVPGPTCWCPDSVDPGNFKGKWSQRGKTYLLRDIKRD